MGAIYLVRHGQASFGADDYDVLSEQGAAQSAAVGVELHRRGVRPRHACSGTLTRQRATAAAALAECAPELAVTQDPRWNEYDHTDIAKHHGTGAVQDSADPRAFQAELDLALAAWVAAGESSQSAQPWPAFLAAATGALDDLVAALGKGEQAVVFTSGGVIAAICGHQLGAAGSSLTTLNRVAVNGAITKIVSGRAGTSLLSFNEHGHFDGAGASLLSYR